MRSPRRRWDPRSDAGTLAHWVRASALWVPVAAGLVSVIGVANARLRARIRRVDVPIAGLPASLDGFTIAQISDIHVGPTIKRRYLEAIVDAVNALGADMIAVTGDLVDGSVEHLSEHTQPLSRLSARHGAYFVTGNHEYYSGAKAWIAEIRRLGLRVLQNEHVVLDHDGESVVVGGVTDFGAHHYDPAQRSDPVAALKGAPRDAPCQAAARPPAALGVRGDARGLRPAAVGPHAWRTIPAVEFFRAPAAAVHRRPASARLAVGLHQPRNGLLGAADALRRAVGDHRASTGRRLGAAHRVFFVRAALEGPGRVGVAVGVLLSLRQIALGLRRSSALGFEGGAGDSSRSCGSFGALLDFVGCLRRLQRDVGLWRRLGCLHNRASCALARHSRSPCA